MIIPLEPVPKPRMTRSDRWKKRTTVVRYFAFCDQLRLLWKEPVPPELALRFYITMPKSWSKKKKLDMDGKPHQQRPDIDNLVKAFLDALCEDDSYVYKIHCEKYWSTDGRIEVDNLS